MSSDGWNLIYLNTLSTSVVPWTNDHPILAWMADAYAWLVPKWVSLAWWYPISSASSPVAPANENAFRRSPPFPSEPLFPANMVLFIPVRVEVFTKLFIIALDVGPKLTTVIELGAPNYSTKQSRSAHNNYSSLNMLRSYRRVNANTSASASICAVSPPDLHLYMFLFSN